MSRLERFEATVDREIEDRVFRTKESTTATFRFMKETGPKGETTVRASLSRLRTDDAKAVDEFVFSGGRLSNVNRKAKQISVHEIPGSKLGELADSLQFGNQFALLFGMELQAAKERYQIQWTGEDHNYVYLDFEPRRPRDRTRFNKAQLALLQASFLPRRLIFMHANGTRETWDLPRINADAQHLRPGDFDPPALPPGWKKTP